jgi:putative ubiquitin-RnfH superfamily antitoxin RatB of RatAB toxin-antitoxin module
MTMGQIDYFGHEFVWKTHKRQDGLFEAMVSVNGCSKVLGVWSYRKAAWRAAKAAAMDQLEIYRKIIIIQAGMKRKERAFRAMARGKFVVPAPASNYSTQRTNEMLSRIADGII